MTCRDYDIRINANKIHSVLKSFAHYFPDEFEKTDILMCGHCNGTGLENLAQPQPEFFCPNCGGTGYVGYEKITKLYTCRGCNGAGCDFCDWTGMTDWISHANGRDINESFIQREEKSFIEE